MQPAGAEHRLKQPGVVTHSWGEEGCSGGPRSLRGHGRTPLAGGRPRTFSDSHSSQGWSLHKAILQSLLRSVIKLFKLGRFLKAVSDLFPWSHHGQTQSPCFTAVVTDSRAAEVVAALQPGCEEMEREMRK